MAWNRAAADDVVLVPEHGVDLPASRDDDEISEAFHEAWADVVGDEAWNEHWATRADDTRLSRAALTRIDDLLPARSLVRPTQTGALGAGEDYGLELGPCCLPDGLALLDGGMNVLPQGLKLLRRRVPDRVDPCPSSGTLHSIIRRGEEAHDKDNSRRARMGNQR